jgi:hypothetical protein
MAAVRPLLRVWASGSRHATASSTVLPLASAADAVLLRSRVLLSGSLADRSPAGLLRCRWRAPAAHAHTAATLTADTTANSTSASQRQQRRHGPALRPEVTEALAAVGAGAPTSIQAAAAPVILSGSDAWLACETGSGKTLAYLAPLFSLLRQHEVAVAATEHTENTNDESGDNNNADESSAGVGFTREPYRPRALVLAPTVELVEQIAAVAKGLSHHAKLRVLGLDVPQASAARRLAAGVDLVVATPGRVRTLRERGVLFLSRIEHVVLDEADTLLDENFAAETVALSGKPELAAALRAAQRRVDGVEGDAEWDAAPPPSRRTRAGAAADDDSKRPSRKAVQLIAVGATLRRDSYEMLRGVMPDMVRIDAPIQPTSLPTSTARLLIHPLTCPPNHRPPNQPASLPACPLNSQILSPIHRPIGPLAHLIHARARSLQGACRGNDADESPTTRCQAEVDQRSSPRDKAGSSA